MFRAKSARSYLIELMVVFVGVVLAFGVENLRESLNEREVGEQYLEGFRQDMLADLSMLDAAIADREQQLADARTALEFLDGGSIDPQTFFGAYYQAILIRATRPNRSTMDEVLNSGNLRLIRDPDLRQGLLDLYVSYGLIRDLEAHMDRDTDAHLYEPTFSSIPLDITGPWADTPANRAAMQTLRQDVDVRNGVYLMVLNLEWDGQGLLDQLRGVRGQVEALLGRLPAA